jgi:hypothetical protein
VQHRHNPHCTSAVPQSLRDADHRLRANGCRTGGWPTLRPFGFREGWGNKGAVPFEPEGEVKSQRLSMSRLVHLTARLNLLPSRAAYLPCCPELHAHRRR